MATQTTTTILPVEYKGYTIQEDGERYMTGYLLYPTEAGIQHDYDGDSEGFHYCGNCKWADSIEEAKDIIDEIVG